MQGSVTLASSSSCPPLCASCLVTQSMQIQCFCLGKVNDNVAPAETIFLTELRVRGGVPNSLQSLDCKTFGLQGVAVTRIFSCHMMSQCSSSCREGWSWRYVLRSNRRLCCFWRSALMRDVRVSCWPSWKNVQDVQNVPSYPTSTTCCPDDCEQHVPL
jgi:hypothetical protein